MAKRNTSTKEMEEIIRQQHSRLDDCTSLFMDLGTIAEKLYRDMYELDEMQLSALLNAIKCMADKGLDVSCGEGKL